jgi:hypothetical protein
MPRRFGLEELAGLTGLSPRRLRDALHRLESARLLDWSESAVEFPASAGAVLAPDRDAFERFLDGIPNHDRLVPVPRRTLRLLAGGARPALIATILGHLLRCLYLKNGKCSARGRVKSSWIAHTFGVGLRRVKEARQELIAMGWLIPLEARQWELNRWGAHVRINLNWSRLDGLENPPAAPAARSELAPPAPVSDVELAPPESDDKPLSGCKNQEPAKGGPAGVFNVGQAGKTPQAGQPQPHGGSSAPAAPMPPAHSKPPVLPARRPECAPAGKPDLRNVVPGDFRDTGRLLDLYEQAVGLGLVTASECGRLRFVAVAEHAQIIGTKNPCGLFVRLVRGGLWHFATYDDETTASVRLRQHLHGIITRGAEQSPGLRQVTLLSDDARLVQALREVAVRSGLRGDPFPLLKREKPEWTRERWDRAVTELGG